MTWSGSATCFKVRPPRPGCPPGLRPNLPCNDFGLGLASPSLEGGFEEFREFAPTAPYQLSDPRILLSNPGVLLEDLHLQTGDLRGLRDDQLSELLVRRIGQKHIEVFSVVSALEG